VADTEHRPQQFGCGVTISGGATAYSYGKSEIFGNGTNVSGSLNKLSAQ
jgi:hypothetical protein